MVQKFFTIIFGPYYLVYAICVTNLICCFSQGWQDLVHIIRIIYFCLLFPASVNQMCSALVIYIPFSCLWTKQVRRSTLVFVLYLTEEIRSTHGGSKAEVDF